MKAVLHQILFILLVTITICSCNSSNPEVYSIREKVKTGDSIAWVSPTYNDSAWDSEDDFNPGDVFWIRHNLQIPETYQKTGVGIMIGATASYEMYWDGFYIGTNGKLASSNGGEKPGTYHAYFGLPDSLVHAGSHTVAMRSTKQFTNIGQHSYMDIGDYQTMLTSPLQVSKWMFLIAGIFLVAFIYFLFLFAAQPKDYSILVFSIICLVVLALLLMEYLKLYYLYEYPFQRTRLEIIGYLHLALTFLVPFFFMLHFDFRWKKYLLLALVIVALNLEYFFHESFDAIAVKHNQVMWIASWIVVAVACYNRKKEGYIVMVGFILSFIVIKVKPFFNVNHVSNYDVSLFLSFMIIIFSMLFVMTYKRKKEREAFEASLILSERLKNDLLKKNIKPHFIMNTLTSLIDWVEESPKEGVKFIHSLANEFEVLNEIADFKKVPINQEIKLCKSHLKVMGFRKEVDYVWEDFNIDANEIIPPAILHTIIENGVSHSIPNEKGQIIFKLSFAIENNWKCYSLEVNAKNRNQSLERTNREGTGIKYIKARLQESFPNNWEFDSHATQSGWITIIKFK